MTLNIDVIPRDKAWLADQSAHLGLPLAEIVKRLIDAQLPPVTTQEDTEQSVPLINAKNSAAIALLDSWIAEGIGADEETMRQAALELEELQRNLNANRAALGDRLVFP